MFWLQRNMKQCSLVFKLFLVEIRYRMAILALKLQGVPEKITSLLYISIVKKGTKLMLILLLISNTEQPLSTIYLRRYVKLKLLNQEMEKIFFRKFTKIYKVTNSLELSHFEYFSCFNQIILIFTC